jgi:hypothetical protein
MNLQRIWGIAEAVSKLGALERGTCGSTGVARRLTECLGSKQGYPEVRQRRALTAKKG